MHFRVMLCMNVFIFYHTSAFPSKTCYSHPSFLDTVLSRVNAARKKGEVAKPVRVIIRELGFRGLWLGVGTRCVFTGLLSVYTHTFSSVANCLKSYGQLS